MPDQYQKEIEEILKKVESDDPTGLRRRDSKPSLARLLWLQARHSVGGKTWSISPGRIMLTAGILLLAWLVLKPVIPSLAGYLAWAGLLVFIIGYGMFFVKPSKGDEKKWRGQPLDDRPERPHGSGESWWDRFRRRVR